jgi:hypothetical protein
MENSNPPRHDRQVRELTIAFRADNGSTQLMHLAAERMPRFGSDENRVVTTESLIPTNNRGLFWRVNEFHVDP